MKHPFPCKNNEVHLVKDRARGFYSLPCWICPFCIYIIISIFARGCSIKAQFHLFLFNAEEAAMSKLCDLQIHINDEETFLLNEKLISKYCGRVKILLNQEKRRCHIKKMSIEINDFPGGPDGFELVLRFCYNNGKILITTSNVLILHCCALYLEMTEKVFINNLLKQAETFLEGINYWTWNETLVSLKSCELFYTYLERCGFLESIICAISAKMAQNSDVNLLTSSSSSPQSSPESNCAKRLISSTQLTPKMIKSSFPSKAWWFDDFATLPPKIIEKFVKCNGAYLTDNKNLLLTRFLLHYLKTVTPKREKLKKVGRLIDKYLTEISPDQNLKISTFLGAAESLPDSARDCFDGVYRAIDIYLESRPVISFEEGSKLCICLNYNKLSFEACKDLAKNPRIPPRIAMQALICQQKNIPLCDFGIEGSEIMSPSQIILYDEDNTDSFLEEKEDIKLNLERMQWRVSELEKLCTEMKVQMLRFTRQNV
ncbi:BTB/POZ domain-containing protein At3g19850-like isoform X2 [Lotus japonicus]|uniref:BTB/POZ domain-containing protein At3g19850-like isoform X2 n=1 Tax=Lotus japonicus TaxID=34305 RepID=UPI00258A1101|nr:BTB/POZ domain-containing protein At3g19850-like isoform X2 [Lotus japonicus]